METTLTNSFERKPKVSNPNSQKENFTFHSEKLVNTEINPKKSDFSNDKLTVPEVTSISRPPTFKASFTKEIASALTGTGINVACVNPVPIGEGANHIVYAYDEPEQVAKVIKLAKPGSITTFSENHHEERENAELGMRQFKEYAASTQILTDPENEKFYCILQEAVMGKSLSNKNIKNNPQLQRQLEEIVRLNRDLYKKHKMSLDFAGMPGFFSWVRRQLMKFIFRSSEFDVSNILITPQNKLKIIDFEYFKYDDQLSLMNRFKNFIGHTANRILMKHYFGLDIDSDD